jgi:sarcosine oxidase subunit alpha
MSRRPIPLQPRLPESLTPGFDRTATVTITFEGQPIAAYAGDTVASAIQATGRQVVSRSFKYHRPRGLLCCAGRCPNCLVNINGTPNARACMTTVAEGMRVEPQNALPSLRLDAFAIFDKLDRLLPPGFYYKTFIYPRRAWPLYETVLRNIAGLGKLDFEHVGPLHAVRRHLHPDVAVIGGGAAGLSAAIAAAEHGLRVVVVDENPALGGHLRGETRIYQHVGEYSGRAGHQIVEALAARLRACPTAQVLTGATAIGIYEDKLIAVAQGDTLVELRAACMVIATGSFEHPLVFNDNDLPGVMLGSAAVKLMHLWGVRPGDRAVVVSAHDDGLRVALDLLEAGIDVAMVADHRHELPPSPELRALAKARVRMLSGWSIAGARGRGRVEGATLIQLDRAGNPIPGTERRGRCSLIAVSTGLETNASLLWQAGCRMTYDEQLDLFTPQAMADGVFAAGDVTGVRDLGAALAGGFVAGREAALSIGAGNGDSAALDAARAALAARTKAFHAAASAPVHLEGRKAFICPCEDVTLKDIDWAVQEGFDHIETLKRYSTVSMGPCQGKMCAMNALTACSRATGRSIADTGTTTARPLTQPTALGTLGGPHLDPTRLTPVHDLHLKAGAVIMDAGQWARPRHYTSPEAECEAVRKSVGIIDVSTLGKLDVRGRDAVTLLERVYTNKWSDLKVGHVRYGLMVDDSGIITDDGTGARIGDDHFYITTTSSGVGAVVEGLTWAMEGTDLQVHVTNVTSAYAAVNLAGPRSREVLAKLTDLDVSAAALPYLKAAQGTVAGLPAIILRIGFVGELGYEIHVPAEYGEHLWTALLEAGNSCQIVPFGVEAQRILRLEKGHIIVTQDTDALSTPLEAGLGWAVKFDKPEFVGKITLAYLKERGPAQRLVGFEMLNVTALPDEGCQILDDTGLSAGRVTSARYSPTLRKAIGLAWVPVACAAPGSTLRIRIDGNANDAKVVPTPFYDPTGARMKS